MGDGPVDAVEHVMELKRRAERAERERDGLREGLEPIVNALESRGDESDYTCPHCGSEACWTVGTAGVLECIRTALPVIREAEDWRRLARAALSADADADAEPEPSCDCEPIRHEDGYEHEPSCAVRRNAAGSGGPCGVCGRNPALGHASESVQVSGVGWVETWYCHDGPSPTCYERREWPSRAEGVPPCDCEPIQEEGGDVHRALCAKSLYKERVAEGGRPREADPQGPSIGTGDASVDGGGDDGRSRAIEAALLSDPDPDCHYGIPRLRGLVARAIDDALASGGVVSAEYLQEWVGAYWKVSETRDKAQARVRELWVALRGLVAATAGLFHPDDVPPDLAEAFRQARAALEGGRS